MSEPDPDIQRWLQLVMDEKITMREFMLLGNDKGMSPEQLLNACMGLRVTMRIPKEAKRG